MRLPEIQTYRVNTGLVPDAHLVTPLLVAMRHGLAVQFDYDGKTRVVEVHAIGVSGADGSAVMRGYQVDGDASRPLPAWSLFTLNKIEGLRATFIESSAPRPEYKMGDRQMADMIAELRV